MSESIRSDDGPKCPYCGYEHTDASRDIIYWGSQDGPVKFGCSSCDQTFEVREIVTRVWESTPIVQKVAKEA